MLGTILLVILILALVGSLPAWPYSRGWGPYPSGGVGLLLVIIIVLLLAGRLSIIGAVLSPLLITPAWADTAPVVNAPAATDVHVNYTPLLNAGIELLATIVLAAWGWFNHQRHLDDSARQAVIAAVPRALPFAEARLGQALDASHLGDTGKQTPFLAMAAGYLNAQVPGALARLKLTPDKIENLLTAQLGVHVADKGSEAPADGATAGAAAGAAAAAVQAGSDPAALPAIDPTAIAATVEATLARLGAVHDPAPSTLEEALALVSRLAAVARAPDPQPAAPATPAADPAHAAPAAPAAASAAA